MNHPVTYGFEAHPISGEHRTDSLIRQQRMQHICGQAFVLFGVVVLEVSLYKLISAFLLDASPWPELQLGAAKLMLVASGMHFPKLSFLNKLLSENSLAERARRSFLMLAPVAFIMVCVVLAKLSFQDIYRYKRLLGEGGILEYLQALILFTSAWGVVAHLQGSLQALVHALAFSNLRDHFFGNAFCLLRGDCLVTNPVRMENP